MKEIKINQFNKLSLNLFIQKRNILKEYKIINDSINEMDLTKLKILKERDEFFNTKNEKIEEYHFNINSFYQTIPIENKYKRYFKEMIEEIYTIHNYEIILYNYHYEFLIRFYLLEFYQLIRTYNIQLKYPIFNDNKIILNYSSFEHDSIEFEKGMKFYED